MIRQWPLVGRSEELAVIADCMRATGGIVLSGPAGVGKTRLAGEAVAGCGTRRTHRRWIAGTASGRNVPLGAFADIAGDFGPDPLRRVREVIDALVGDGPGQVVIGVDDAHLLDDLSAFTVHQLVSRRLATVIVTVRSGEAAPEAIAAIWTEHHLDRLELQPLSLVETTQLVEHVLDGPVQSLSARRLWQFTQGNVLYLRHLVDSEVGAGRLTQRTDLWVWEGQPELSPTLAELLEARIAEVPRRVRDVLDALAVAEPLDAAVLAAVTDRDGLTEAESLGLVVVAPGERATVRLAHPLFGEVRRTGSLRLRQLSGRIAAELGRRGSTDPRDLVRRAMLSIQSDLSPDSDLFVAAASAATHLLDVRLALALAERAVAGGGGPSARIAQAMANFWLERPLEAESILAELASETTGATRTRVAALRISNLAGELGRPESAERELDATLSADDTESTAIAGAFRALIDIVRGNADAAVAQAMQVLAEPPADEFAHMHAIFVAVSGLGDLGRIEEIEPVAETGYRLADSSPGASHARFQLAFLQANAYRCAGALSLADAAIARIRRETLDVPFEESWHCLLAGMSAMNRGSLAEAQRLVAESLTHLGGGDGGRVIKGFGRSWLTTLTGMAGRAAEARGALTAIDWWAQEPAACVWDPERSLAQAWTCAAEGAVSQAISIMRTAADAERDRGRPGWEVVLLQAATQFGDSTTATRLAQLATQVQGPRAAAASAHAGALAAGDTDALLDASRRYEAFGDRLAAGDAAAHAVTVSQHAGKRGTAMNAEAVARRLAGQCRGATPALRAATTTQPFTPRQHEIISLAAHGLSNKEIAERLMVSTRSVEGHLFRASQRVGAKNRGQLIAVLRACSN